MDIYFRRISRTLQTGWTQLMNPLSRTTRGPEVLELPHERSKKVL